VSRVPPAVAQTSSLPYRGFPIRLRREVPKLPVLRRFGRLEVGDTAGWKPALRIEEQSLFVYLVYFVMIDKMALAFGVSKAALLR
jgi:hypothetical protein